MEKSFKYRIYPNKKQKIQIAKTFGCVRFVYNHYLSVRKSAYEDEKKSLNYYDCSNDLKIINLLRPLLMSPGVNLPDSLFIRLAGMANKLSRWISGLQVLRYVAVAAASFLLQKTSL